MRLEEMFHEIESLKNDALDGEINELKAWSELYELEKRVASAKDEIKDSVLYKLGDSKVDDFGYRFERTQSGRYDYSEIEEWNNVNYKRKEIEKQSQDAYKQALSGKILVSPDGEPIPTAKYISNEPSVKLTKLK